MTEIIEKGGIMMIPIIASSALALAVIIDRIYIFFIKTKFLKKETINDIIRLVENGERKKAIELLKNEDSIFKNFFLSVLEEEDPGEYENAATISGEDILFYLNRRLNILSVLGSVLPLMGLLGTVLGMIKVFSMVAHAGDAADITLLAGGIWEALITTAAGMAVAIPVVLIYHYLNRTIEKTAHSMQQKISQLILVLKRG